MIAILRRNATASERSFWSRCSPPRAGGTTALPSATNKMIAAAVDKLVMRWLLARRTAQLLPLSTNPQTSLPGRIRGLTNGNENIPTAAETVEIDISVGNFLLR